MRRLLLSLTAAVSLLVASLGAAASPPAHAAIGDSPVEGEPLPNEDFHGTAVWEPGESHWFRLVYPGGGEPLALTLHLRPEDEDIRDLINVYINVREHEDETLGDPDADWEGFARIGQLTRTDDTGELRKFWMNSTGDWTEYFVLVRNGSKEAVPIALSVEREERPAEYIMPSFEAAGTSNQDVESEPTMPPSSQAPQPSEPLFAVAELIDRNGAPIGTALLGEAADGTILLHIEAAGLEPGRHGMHFHAVGACDPPDFTSAGDHFNPDARQHGVLSGEGPHAGDLPNLEVADDGTVFFEVETELVTLAPGEHSLLDADGTALIIHAMADDHVSNPSGNAGDRIACGVIELAR